jgi:hypothetical protein
LEFFQKLETSSQVSSDAMAGLLNRMNTKKNVSKDSD